ncbi:hypothetical protein MY5147_006480 [Beauveria neobassiana]
MPPRHSLRGAPSEALLCKSPSPPATCLCLEDSLLALSSHASSLLQLNTYTARYPLTGRLVLPKVGRLIESVNSLMT